ncbi:uroporphyrinogen-III synthase [Caminibacter pacificus]|uniref:Uroporphyrinogen-III synthase n=1 Tax=Caminibacter pacificus TaxID=1424653 RepID=A0AAJ4RE28_9BACT|nr:uroporphyrinogen-III synthase [Caminibacter pacificus]ROR40953.1 uroporphyrinogen-III synthase [Caminibacter pacificus]
MIKNLPIYLLTDEKKEGILNYPVIKINFLSPQVSFEGVDFLIFTSKNGVRAIDNLTSEWKKIPSLAIGKATVNEIKQRGGILEYTAKSSYGEDFAKEIVSKYNNKTFLFLRAKKILSDIKSIFDSSTNTLIEKIVYETVCNRPKGYIKRPAFVIFSSPSTVECFLKIENIENIIPIAIGKKTRDALLAHKINNYLMPKKPGIKECIELAKNVKFK